MLRKDGRAPHEVRRYTLRQSPYGYADGAVLFSLGGTTVLVTVSLQDKVPPFLRGQGTGWLTAEYAMLPTATRERTQRESSSVARNGRSVEISRLIGRVLRSVTDLTVLGERTITIDCDVMQADGGTRTAAITAASHALLMAQEVWRTRKLLKGSVLTEPIAALSSGSVGGVLCVDLSQEEDADAGADFNFVMTRSGLVVEVQGTGERSPLAWEEVVALKEMTAAALQPFFALVPTPKE